MKYTKKIKIVLIVLIVTLTLTLSGCMEGQAGKGKAEFSILGKKGLLYLGIETPELHAGVGSQVTATSAMFNQTVQQGQKLDLTERLTEGKKPVIKTVEEATTLLGASVNVTTQMRQYGL